MTGTESVYEVTNEGMGESVYDKEEEKEEEEQLRCKGKLRATEIQ